MLKPGGAFQSASLASHFVGERAQHQHPRPQSLGVGARAPRAQLVKAFHVHVVSEPCKGPAGGHCPCFTNDNPGAASQVR